LDSMVHLICGRKQCICVNCYLSAAFQDYGYCSSKCTWRYIKNWDNSLSPWLSLKRQEHILWILFSGYNCCQKGCKRLESVKK
jgi:hypothetical protein